MSCRAVIPIHANSYTIPSPRKPHHSGRGGLQLVVSVRQRRWQAAALRASWSPEDDGGAVSERRTTASFYDLLRIPVTGSYEKIKSAYKKMARQFHPDVSPPDRLEENTLRFIEVKEAYETLSDPSRRARYDRYLADSLHLDFSFRRKFDEKLDGRSLQKYQWHDQLEDLKRRGESKNPDENLSWGALMRTRSANSVAGR